MKDKSQRAAILNHLKKEGSITTMAAFRQYGVTRLSAVIFDLRKLGETAGFEIETINMKHINRYGNAGMFAKYVYREVSE